MADVQLEVLLQRVACLAGRPALAGATDGDLLGALPS